MDNLISNMLSESILDFRKGSNWKYANTRICIFSVWPLPKVENWFQKQIWNENIHIYILNFLKSFGQYFKKSENGFPIVFFTDQAHSSTYPIHTSPLIGTISNKMTFCDIHAILPYPHSQTPWGPPTL